MYCPVLYICTSEMIDDTLRLYQKYLSGGDEKVGKQNDHSSLMMLKDIMTLLIKIVFYLTSYDKHAVQLTNLLSQPAVIIFDCLQSWEAFLLGLSIPCLGFVPKRKCLPERIFVCKLRLFMQLIFTFWR